MLINQSLLYEDHYPLNNGMELRNPTVKDVISFSEPKFSNLCSLFITYPIDIVVELFMGAGKDFEVFYKNYTKLTQHDIFIMLFSMNSQTNNELLSFLLGDVNFVVAPSGNGDEVVLVDEEKGFVFDLTSFLVTSAFIRAIHHNQEDVSKTAKKSKALLRATVETEMANRQYLEEQKEKDRQSGKFDNRLRKSMTKVSVASQFRRSEMEQMKLFEFNEIMMGVSGFTFWKLKMGGYFSGNFDLSKVDKKEFDWFS